MDHHFNTAVAKDFDISVATLLQNFKFWTLTNLANKRNIYDGYCWTYNSVEAFGLIFEYLSRHQIEHLLKKCVKEGLLVVGNYNATKYDRTKWYALTARAYQYFPELLKENYIENLYDSISENSEIMFGDFRNQFLNFPKPIPDNNPDIKTDDYIDSDESNSCNKIKPEEIVHVYHEELPQNPKVEVIGDTLKTQLNNMQKNWKSKYSPNNLPFSLESFRQYLRYLKTNHSWFINERTYPSGKIGKNGIRTITKPKNLEKFRNNEFD